MFDPSKTIEGIQKLAPKTLVAIAIATALVLFLPTPFLRILHLEVIRDGYGSWIGATCLISTSLLSMHCIWKVVGTTKACLETKRQKRIREQYLKELMPEEKGFLLPFIRNQETTRRASIDDGVANGLVARMIVYRSAQAFEFDAVPYNLHPWARTYLRDNPELLKGAVDYPPKENRY